MHRTSPSPSPPFRPLPGPPGPLPPPCLRPSPVHSGPSPVLPPRAHLELLPCQLVLKRLELGFALGLLPLLILQLNTQSGSKVQGGHNGGWGPGGQRDKQGTSRGPSSLTLIRA